MIIFWCQAFTAAADYNDGGSGFVMLFLVLVGPMLLLQMVFITIFQSICSSSSRGVCPSSSIPCTETQDLSLND